MKICAVILVALCVTSTISVSLTGSYVNLQWYKNGANSFTFQVGGVVVNKPNDYTVGISAKNTYKSTNVQCLMMDYNNMKYLPGNYTRFFSSIQFLIVRNSHVKYVTNADFLGLKYLVHIDFLGNKIEHLPGNLFQGVKYLSAVSFLRNRITNVGPNFIANIIGLKSLYLSGNPCINLNSSATFNSFTETFKTKCQLTIILDVFTDPPPTSEEYQKLNATNVNLMNKNTNLTAEIKLLEITNNHLKQDIEDKNKLLMDLEKTKLFLAKLQTEITKLKTDSLQTMKSTNDKNKSIY